MSNLAKVCRSSVIPALRYRNALAGIEWLCKAFGFEKNAVYMGEGDTVAHAQLTFGNGMIMLGSIQTGTEYSKEMVQPDEVGMRETQHACLIVSDATAVYATANAAGAEIVTELKEMDYGGKAFSCRDPEGHLWSIGEYDPWEAHGE
jgi:uncharacterized glyoxalase superfamily protein PhnB